MIERALHAATRQTKLKSIVRNFAQQIVPYQWRADRNQKREEALIASWYRDWLALRSRLSASTGQQTLSDNCLLIPSDTRTFTGGKGDEAMTLAIIEALREAGQRCVIHVMCETDAAFAAARELGCEPFGIPQDLDYLATFDRWLAEHRPSIAIGIGADSIDGAYGVVGRAGLMTVLDLAAHRGALAMITGFSVRERTAPALAPFFTALRPDVRLNVRDPLSLKRLRSEFGREGELVADTAFLLRPQSSPRIDALRQWVDAIRASGRLAIAINVHPMLFARDDEAGKAKLVDDLAAAIRTVTQTTPVGWALVAHDFREGDADALLLEPLAERLADLGDNVFAAYGTMLGAAELKAASALFDGVVSARMHFAIAALGSGVPVLGIVYQGKFEGLLELFDLPPWLSISPESTTSAFSLSLQRFIAELPVLRAHVERQGERIHALSALNFADLRSVLDKEDIVQFEDVHGRQQR